MAKVGLVWRLLVFVVVVIAVVPVSSVTTIGAAGDKLRTSTTTTGPAPSPTDCRQRYPRTTGDTAVQIIVTRGPTAHSVRLQFPRELPDGFDVVLPSSTTVRNYSGFHALDGAEYRATPSGNHTLIYEFNETGIPADTSLERTIRPFEGAEDWILAPLPEDYDKQRYYPVNVSYTSPHAAAFGEELVYFGEHETFSQSWGCHELQLVVPDEVSLGMAPADIFEQLSYADNRLSAASRYTQVTIFASQENFTDTRGNARESDIVIAAEAAQRSMTSIWLHEYIHTRQSVYTRGNMTWWTEATAEYLAGRFLLDSGDLSPRQYNQYLQTKVQRSPDGVALADTTTWRNDSTYSRGFVVLAALDARIRNATNGSTTFIDVFRQINQRDHITKLPTFVQALEQTTGIPWDYWIQQYVTGSKTPPVATVETNNSTGVADRMGSLIVLVLFVILLVELASREPG